MFRGDAVRKIFVFSAVAGLLNAVGAVGNQAVKVVLLANPVKALWYELSARFKKNLLHFVIVDFWKTSLNDV